MGRLKVLVFRVFPMGELDVKGIKGVSVVAVDWRFRVMITPGVGFRV